METSLIAVFMTGLITGGLTCLAVQGGLLAATVAQREEERLKNNLQKSGNALPILSFLVAKLIAYTVLGFLLGLLGSFFRLSLTATNIINFAVAIFMIGTALSILNVHPIFRYFIIQPPHFLTRFIRKQSKSGDIFAPAILGAFTVFIPCGTTQAMMALSIAAGSPIYGAAILFAFVLGTSPLFFTLGYLATRLSETLHQKFMRFAAFAIILLAIYNINNSIALTGINFGISEKVRSVYCVFTFCKTTSAQASNPVTSATIELDDKGYFPKNLTLKSGTNVTLNLKNINGRGCIQSFTIPSLGIQTVLPLGSSQTGSFKTPEKPTEIAFMCGMGMYRGSIFVRS